MPLLKKDKHKIIPMIIFLRNLIRATTMSSLLCGTNSQANNLIGENDTEFSGKHDGIKRWVKVLTELIRANMKSLCCNIEFTSNDGQTKFYASDFSFIENGQLNLDFKALFIAMFEDAFEGIPHHEDAKKLFQFIFKNVNTTLPGIASAATKFIFDSIKSAKVKHDSLNNLWTKLNKFMISTVAIRKPKISSYDGLVSSLHLLTFPSKFKHKNEMGHVTKDLTNIVQSSDGNTANPIFSKYTFEGSHFLMQACPLSLKMILISPKHASIVLKEIKNYDFNNHTITVTN